MFIQINYIECYTTVDGIQAILLIDISGKYKSDT